MADQSTISLARRLWRDYLARYWPRLALALGAMAVYSGANAAIAFGVTGAPETFLVDAKGVIRHKIVGPLDKKIWENTLKPMIERLRKIGSS